MLYYTHSSTIYVSSSEGNDYYTGFAPHPIESEAGAMQGPFKTIRHAMELIAGIRISSDARPITVCIEGEHYLETPLEISLSAQLANAGYQMSNVTFESYGEGRARIVGGRRLTGFAHDTFRGVPCFSLHIPDVKAGKWHFTDLYVNGQRACAARYPREGTLRASEVERDDVISFAGLHQGSRWFIAEKDSLSGVEGIENAIVSYYNYWIDEHSPVESYDPESGKLVMAYRSRFNINAIYGKGYPSEFCYYLENIPTEFGAPNDWYLDVPNGMLYYAPSDSNANPDTIEVFAPTVKQIVNLLGTAEAPVTGIRFRGLDFICSRGDYASTSPDPSGVPTPSDNYASDSQSVSDAYGAIRFEYTKNCALEDCRMSCTGLHAVEISCGCESIRIERSHMSELGGGGVKIFGSTDDSDNVNKTSHCSVIGSTITHIGLRYAAACGILICHSSYNEISDNEISYTVYSGVSVGWVWGYTKSSTYSNIIRNNHVHHIGIGLLSDMAGIYLLGIQSGTVVEGNYIHDVNSASYGGHGIYTDEGSSYITIEGNTVINTKSSCFFQHYGVNNTVRNNVFAFGHDGVISLATKGRVLGNPGVVFEGNSVIADGDEPIYNLASLGGAISTLRASRNRFWHIDGHAPALLKVTTDEGEKALDLSSWQEATGLDEESLCAPIELPHFDKK